MRFRQPSLLVVGLNTSVYWRRSGRSFAYFVSVFPFDFFVFNLRHFFPFMICLDGLSPYFTFDNQKLEMLVWLNSFVTKTF